MDASQFKYLLEEAGYREITTRTMEPAPQNGEHAHEFSVRGLVTAGEFIVSCDGVPRSHRPGDEFEVAAGQLHTEAVGPQGACVTAGRKY